MRRILDMSNDDAKLFLYLILRFFLYNKKTGNYYFFDNFLFSLEKTKVLTFNKNILFSGSLTEFFVFKVSGCNPKDKISVPVSRQPAVSICRQTQGLSAILIF